MRRCPGWIAFALTSFGLMAGASCQAQVRDVELKAAYIYNFAMFTTWPDGPAQGPLLVCANPDSALWPSLQALNGRAVNGRAWTLLDFASAKGGRCDIAVLQRASPRTLPSASGVLVVRDGLGTGAAAITLVDDDEHVRFDIDTREAAKAGLRFSSRLLRLARNVQ